MISGYMDRTFCPFHETCKWSQSCTRSLTDEVIKGAQAWWLEVTGDEDRAKTPPIMQFAFPPDCHTEIDDEEAMLPSGDGSPFQSV